MIRKIFGIGFFNFLRMLDRSVGLIGNLQNWTSPLYGDYSLIGVVVGPILRTLRIFFGLAFYMAIAVFSLAVYLFWIILPIAVIIIVFLNLLVLVKTPEQVFALGEGIVKIIYSIKR